MSPKISKDLSKHRLEQAREDLIAAKLLYDSSLFKSANNRAYYFINSNSIIYKCIRKIL